MILQRPARERTLEEINDDSDAAFEEEQREERRREISDLPERGPRDVPAGIALDDLLELAGLDVPTVNFAADMLTLLPGKFPRCHAGRQLSDQYYALEGRLIKRALKRPEPPGSLLLFWETAERNNKLRYTRCWAGRYGKSPLRKTAVALTAEEILSFYEDFPLLMRNAGFEPLTPDHLFTDAGFNPSIPNPSFGELIPW
jgi:hypothetical protein